MMNRPKKTDEGEETLSRAMAPLRTGSNHGKLTEHGSREDFHTQRLGKVMITKRRQNVTFEQQMAQSQASRSGICHANGIDGPLHDPMFLKKSVPKPD
jgi:hypothetical protein